MDYTDTLIGYHILFLPKAPCRGPPLSEGTTKEMERDAEGQKTVMAFKPSDTDKTQRMVGRLPCAG